MPKYLFPVLLGLFFFAQTQAQTVLYVDKEMGRNNNPGTLDQPVKTVHQAVDLSNPGDTIEIRGGYYQYDRRIRIDKNNLTLRSFPGEWAVIETPTQAGGDAFATIYFSAGVKGGRLERLEIIGGEYYGVMATTVFDNRQPTSQDELTGGITIRNCKIHDTGRDGIKLSAGTYDILIEHCEIYRTGVGPRNIGVNNAEGIDAVNCRNLTVRGCYIHDTWTAGMYAKGGCVDVLYENNLIMNAGSYGIGSGEFTDREFYPRELREKPFQTVNHTIRNNIVINTGVNNTTEVTYKGHHAIKIASTKNLQLYNNTFINGGVGGGNEIAIPLFIFNLPTNVNNENLLIVNNIFYQSKGTGNSSQYGQQMVFLEADLQGNSIIDHNLYYHEEGNMSFGRWNQSLNDVERWNTWQGRGFGASSLTKAPSFVNTYIESISKQGAFDRVSGAFNVHLQANSPALDAGADMAALDKDYDGNLRQDPFDIGADEYRGESLALPPPDNVFGTGLEGVNDIVNALVTYPERPEQPLKVYPNPVQDNFFIELEGLSYRGAALQIKSLAGKRLMRVPRLSDQRIEVDGSRLPAGIFLIELRSGKQVWTTQAVKINR